MDGALADSCDAVLIVVEDGQREVALQVDSLLGKQEVVIKSLGDKFRNLRGVAGGAILGDGRIGLILDVRAIVNYSESQELESHGVGRSRAPRE
jgi:two-component system chemotaxis sensor kinase CheA